MTESDLMPIGGFAERAGLTASALRFYDDAGLLCPEQVDAGTGYRLYSERQLGLASQLRQLRAIDMPLPTIGKFFCADADEAARLIDEQVADVTTNAAEAQQTAVLLRASLGQESRFALCTLPGPALADAVDQVLATTVHDPDLPVLGGVRLEVEPESVALTATDRYRLATRTLVPTLPSVGSWAGTLSGEDLRTASSQLRRSPSVALEAGELTLSFRLADGVVNSRLLTEVFPDYRLMMGSLPAVTHRVTTGKQHMVKSLEHLAPEHVGLRISGKTPQLLLPNGDEVGLLGSATGDDSMFWFELTTLYPALSRAIGADLMLDLRGPSQPATIRSGDDGDLTTLVMPCQAPDPSPIADERERPAS